ncbi:MAG TPA: sigma 54-interacting transcriptional regulator [Candidatus Eisenbacteria bacterium]|nr:sigma 54-interacting transcriptional regulator [Candidatus Eisenbacteria bacterium]
MQRAIPPDLSHPVPPVRDAAAQYEAIGDLHLAADNFAGAIEAYSSALRELPPRQPAERARLLCCLAEAQLRRGEYNAARAILAEARELTRELRDPRTNARIAARLARALVDQGQFRRCRRYAQYAYDVLRDTDDHRTVGLIGVTLGFVCSRLGRNAEAIEWLQNAAATFRRIDDTDGLVSALNNLGLVYKNLREWREATRFLEQALKLDERAGLYARMRLHNQNLGLIRYRLGQWDLADENFRQSLKISRDIGNLLGESSALLALGLLARRRRQLDRADEHFHRAEELARQVGAQREVVLAREFLGETALDRGDWNAALALLGPALDEARPMAPHGDLVCELETRLGLALLGAGRPDEARAHLVRGVALAEQLGDRVEQAIAERAIGRLEATLGNAAALDQRMRAAASCFDQLGEVYELAVTLAGWGEGLLLLPSSARLRVALDPVADAARRAAALFRQLGVEPLAAGALLTLARLEAEREHYDQALGLLEQAERWIAESGAPEADERAIALRRELERQYVAVSLTTCNEFRALQEANQLFRDASDMDGLLAQALKLAAENAGGDRGFVAFSGGGARLDVVAQHALGRDRARRILRVLEQAAGGRLAEGGPLFSSRVAADPRFGSAVADALENVGSLVCVPFTFPSQSVGLVYVDRLSDNLLGPFKQRELNLLAVLANSAAVAIVESQRSKLIHENRVLRDRLKPTPGMERVVTESREMRNILHLLGKVSDSPATILFMGETGTGKGLLAHVVHELSNRRERPFVQVNCAALPEQLLESELFGYVQGAFTGATRDKAGLFEEADGGTIFLDEIEKVPEAVQAKLLHVLDRSEIRPVGATRTRKVDARVICATGCDLRERIREGRFLEDLYYRLNDITVRVPSLRERREDIPVLVQHFLTLYARQMEKNVQGLSPEVMRVFLAHEWRGNVRELEKTIKRMVVLAEDGDTLGPELLPPDLCEGPARDTVEAGPRGRTSGDSRRDGAVASGNGASPNGSAKSLRSSVSQLEKKMIAEALERHRWNKARAARELGLSYPTLLAKIRTLEIERRRG